MTTTLHAEATALLTLADDAYASDPRVRAELAGWRRRLDDPLRLGVAGIVKAGKSTLLNALIGERIAPTDAGECTRVVTWYRYGDAPEATAVRADGSSRRLRLSRVEGALRFDLDGASADETERVEVRWPSSHLRTTVLIDTPGIESVTTRVSERTRALLLRDRVGPDDADAIVYLLRHLHTSDLTFLESFRDTAAGVGAGVNALAVLSRADEVGAGRIDAMLSARKIAERYRRDASIRPLALTVLPVAGLLAETARTLRESEFAAIRTLSRLDRATRESLLLSVDRFARRADSTLTDTARRGLLDRFGISGIRLASALVRGGAGSSGALSEGLLLQSGVEELRLAIDDSLRSRQDALKVRALLTALAGWARERRQPAELTDAIERIEATSHDLRELATLAQVRAAEALFDQQQADEAELILGAHGTAPRARLGLPADASLERVRRGAAERLALWRARGQSPAATRPHTRICGEVAHALEGILSEVAAVERGGTPADVDAARRPADGGGQDREQQREDAERSLSRDHERKWRGIGAGFGELEAEPQRQGEQQNTAEHPPPRAAAAAGERHA